MPETRKTFGDVSVWPSGDLVATVEIGRPPDNFFDAELITSLADACAWLDEQPEFRAAVLCSAGKHFCAGADFTGRSGRTGTGGAKELYAAAARLFEARTPVIAAVQGAAVGGGLGLACAADFRVAGPQARFCANFARLGLHHGFALTVTLPAIIGEQRALDLLCTGRRVGGEEAARIGLADRLAEPEG
ncbi:MAG: enoyl-CoA hydratase/isomerase family protein, partial [Streptosporangiaceae bacterium]